MRTWAETDVAFILKASFAAVTPRVRTQLRFRAAVSFPAVGVAFPRSKKTRERKCSQVEWERDGSCPTSAEVHHRLQQYATQQGPLHPRPGLAHGAVGVPLHGPVAANCHRCLSRQPRPLIWQSRSWVTSSAEECNLLHRGVTAGSNSAQGVEFLPLKKNNKKQSARSCLFFAPSAGNREHCWPGRFRRLLSSSHGWQLPDNVTIFGPQGSGALRRRAGSRKRGQRRNKPRKSLSSDFLFAAGVASLSLATKRSLRPLVVFTPVC